MWVEFFRHWSLWAVYIAQFSMNWSNYIIMQWLPTYLSRNLGANKESISFTAAPYVINSLVGVGKSKTTQLFELPISSILIKYFDRYL